MDLFKQTVVVLLFIFICIFAGVLFLAMRAAREPGPLPRTGGRERRKDTKTAAWNRDDFIDVEYDPYTDDQAHLIVPREEQKFLSKDYTKNIGWCFPLYKRSDDVDIPPRFKTICEANEQVSKICNPSAEGVHWDNQTLSYMRRDVVATRLIRYVIKPLVSRIGNIPVEVVDTTANIGGDSINYAMYKWVKRVTSYEMQENVYKKLVANVKLYGLEDKITTVNRRYDYTVPPGAIVVIDPPYEIANNPNNFNLSIDRMNIYAVAEKILNAGASAVILGMPRVYKYNIRYANDHGQLVEVFRMGQKDAKIYVVTKLLVVKHGQSNLVKAVSPTDWYKATVIPLRR